MSKHERVQQAVYRAIDEVNGQLPVDRRLDKAPDTVLIGDSGKLDSTALVSLLVALEQELDDEFGIEASLTDRDAPFWEKEDEQTVAALVDHASECLGADV